jgi:hypothetical protein
MKKLTLFVGLCSAALVPLARLPEMSWNLLDTFKPIEVDQTLEENTKQYQS